MAKEDDAREKVLMDVIARLREHFDHVQVLVSGETTVGNTFAMYRGHGNWYARQGLAHEFIDQEVAQGNARQLEEILKPSEED